MPINPKAGDIWNYLSMKLERDDKLEATSDDLWVGVAMIVLENISDICVGAFSNGGARSALVSLNIDAIPGEVSYHRRRKKFNRRRATTD